MPRRHNCGFIPSKNMPIGAIASGFHFLRGQKSRFTKPRVHNCCFSPHIVTLTGSKIGADAPPAGPPLAQDKVFGTFPCVGGGVDFAIVLTVLNSHLISQHARADTPVYIKFRLIEN